MFGASQRLRTTGQKHGAAGECAPGCETVGHALPETGGVREAVDHEKRNRARSDRKGRGMGQKPIGVARDAPFPTNPANLHPGAVNQVRDEPETENDERGMHGCIFCGTLSCVRVVQIVASS